MTSHYIDIHLRPDPDFPAGQLMGALFSKLHRRLVELDMSTVGVSFPAHRIKPRDIGDHLRLHGSPTDLATLMASSWLGGMREHADIRELMPAPEQASHRTVSRRQFKTNAERLRRRRMRRHDESAQTALERIPDHIEQRVSLPFVQVRSSSTGQRFSLFVEHGTEQPQPTCGSFNSYGLSRTTTVPWF
ncbi:type I-F CRISPR-associated endoribonuclease Cas6/Csy4 [Salinisphaera sp. SWV1]|uniref:type I-F CRISPR-associated endoribonuclease Cas6/Csy4 n=1 Tax=Salinisphaera sp. SWV1 TaxID=3454139 RepID=UPI003F85E075